MTARYLPEMSDQLRELMGQVLHASELQHPDAGADETTAPAPYRFGPLDELPFTGILVEKNEAGDRAYPIRADGTVGEADPELLLRLKAGEFGNCHTIIYGAELRLIPWSERAHLTPFGPVDEQGMASEGGSGIDRYNAPATLADFRRRQQGHYSHYDDEWVRAIIAAEGLEYAIEGYTTPAHFVQPTRDLAFAALNAITARDDFLHSFAEDEAPDPTRLEQLALAGERAKANLCAHLEIANEPWERDAD
jgi:hypothetical protein